MKGKICQRCGSSEIIADRSLAGRIVCASCGSTKLEASNNFNIVSKLDKKMNTLTLFLLAIAVLVFIVFIA